MPKNLQQKMQEAEELTQNLRNDLENIIDATKSVKESLVQKVHEFSTYKQEEDDKIEALN